MQGCRLKRPSVYGRCVSMAAWRCWECGLCFSPAVAEWAVPSGSRCLSWHLFGCSPGVTALAVSGQVIGSQTGGITVSKVDLQPWRECGLICKGDHAETRPIRRVAAGKAWVMLKDLHPVEGCPVVSRQRGLACLSSAGIRPVGGLLPHAGLW